MMVCRVQLLDSYCEAVRSVGKDEVQYSILQSRPPEKNRLNYTRRYMYIYI